MKNMKTHMKLTATTLMLVAILLFQTSCEEEPQAKLTRLKSEVEQLNAEIEELEIQLADEKEDVLEERKVRINSKRIQPEPFRHYFTVNGTVEADGEAMISPETQGQITAIYAEKGDRVKKGDKLAQLNTAVLDNQIAEVRSRYNLAKDLYEKQDRLWTQNNIGSEVQYLEAKNNKETLEQNLNTLLQQKEQATIKAPISGVLDDIYMKEGDYAAPGQPFAQIVNLEKLFLNADVSESYLTKIRKGDSLDIFFPALGVRKRNAIHRIGNMINPQNRTFKVRIRLNEIDPSIKPNAMARITMSDFATDSAFVVPTVAIQQDMEGHYVYLVKRDEGGAVAHKQYVEPKRSYSGQTMIADGIHIDDEVIVEGYNRVTNGITVITE